MEDCNTTLIALDVATNRLSWYIAFSILASLVSVIAIVISFKSSEKQLKANHDWNRRSFTASQIATIANELMDIRDELDVLTLPKTMKVKGADGKGTNDEKTIGIIKSNNDKYINFSDRINQGEALTSDEVHDWVCEHDKDGKHIPSKKGKNPPCKTSFNGEIIVNNMIKFINIYEQMGINLRNGIYDEKTLRDAFMNPIKANYIFYKEYIQHRVSEHNDKNFGASFKWLYEHFWIEKAEEKRKNTDEKVPAK